MYNFKKYLNIAVMAAGISFTFYQPPSVSALEAPAILSETADFTIKNNTLISYNGNETRVIVPEGVTAIEKGAFYKTPQVEEIIFPDSLTQLKAGTIAEQTNIKKLTFGKNLQFIEDKAIGFYTKSIYYLDPFGNDYDTEIELISDIKFYGPENSPAKTYADKYGIPYNDQFVCRMDAEKLDTYHKNKTSLVLYWDIQYLADGYYIYRSEEKDGTYEKIGEVEQTDSNIGPQMYYTDKALTPGKTYYYRVYSYRLNEKSDLTAISTAYAEGKDYPKLNSMNCWIEPKTSTSLEVHVNTDNVKDADGYYIWRSEMPSSSFKKIAVIKDISVASYIDRNLKTGKTYYYKAGAFDSKDKSLNGEISPIKSAKVIPSSVTSFKAVKKGSVSCRLSWSKRTDCDGYILYRAFASGKPAKIKVIRNTNTTSFTDKGLKKGKHYTYSIRTFKKVSGKNIYSNYTYKSI